MVIKGVLFDADGVIINSGKFSIEYEEKYGVSKDELIPFFKGNFKRCIIGKGDLKELIRPWLIKWKWLGTVEEFLQFWFKAEHQIDERIVSVINQLKLNGKKCYLVTNQEKYRVEYIKNDMGFDKLFNRIFSSSEIGYKKPEKEFYKAVLDEIGKKDRISSDELLFFDDSEINILSAREKGINSHVYKDFLDFEKIIESHIKIKSKK